MTIVQEAVPFIGAFEKHKGWAKKHEKESFENTEKFFNWVKESLGIYEQLIEEKAQS